MIQKPTDYTVLIEAEGGTDERPVDDRDLEELGHAIYYHGDAMTGAGGYRYGVHVHVKAADAADAVSRALDLFHAAVRRAGLSPWTPVEVRAISALESQLMTWRAMEAGRIAEAESGPADGPGLEGEPICATCLELFAGTHDEHCRICLPGNATPARGSLVILEEGRR